jgi:hypothetical protein
MNMHESNKRRGRPKTKINWSYSTLRQVKAGEDAYDHEESAANEDNDEGVGGGRLMMMMIEGGLLQVMVNYVGNAVDEEGWCTCVLFLSKEQRDTVGMLFHEQHRTVPC